MNLKVISRNVGFALLVSALFMFLSIIVCISNPTHNDSALAAFIISFTITFLVGVFPFIFVRKNETISLQDGYMIIALSWLLSFIFGMLPYALWGGPFSVVNAWFESVSGFTTTGATILTDIENVPKSLLFWRSSTHFIGGLGVVVFLLLIIPSSSPIRLRLTNMELSSLSREGYKSRANKTVFIFASVYLGMTVAATLAYMICGMSFFDAINHSFSVVATGGFSTKNLSISQFHSVPIDIVTIIFMVLASIHFGLIFMAVVTHSFKPLNNPVIKYYLASLIVVAAIMSVILKSTGNADTWGTSILYSFFQTASMSSTTGYALADNSRWPLYVSFPLLLIMIQCGCAGSTAGGVKCDRTVVLFKAIGRQIRTVIHPNSVREIKLGNHVIKDDLVYQSALYISLYMIIMVVSAGLLLLGGVEPDNALVVSISSLGNVGPGVTSLGTMGSYVGLSVFAKFVMTLEMFLGRVEIYPILAAISLMFNMKSTR